MAALFGRDQANPHGLASRSCDPPTLSSCDTIESIPRYEQVLNCPYSHIDVLASTVRILLSSWSTQPKLPKANRQKRHVVNISSVCERGCTYTGPCVTGERDDDHHDQLAVAYWTTVL